MATKIQFRRGTASQWTTANPVLAAGEVGWETDTQKFKVGDGSTTWNVRSYFMSLTALDAALAAAVAAAVETATLEADAAAEVAEDAADSATSSATTAGAGASTATTQAGIATTKAGEAATSKTGADTAKTAAETANTAAQTAKTAAQTAQTAAEAAAAGAAAQAALLASIPSALATAQGFWSIFSATPPGVTTMYGVPVRWFDSSNSFNPTVVNPSTPTWDDAASTIVVPSAMVGVDYIHTSGGGGTGATLTQGASVATSGAFPRSVVITPVARPGYVLSAPGLVFRHDFPDPAAITQITSDGFTGVMTTLANRDTDIALGGTSQKWTPLVSAGAANTLRINPSGILEFVTATVGDSAVGLSFLTTHNLQVEFDLLGLVTTGGNSSPLVIGVNRRVATTGAVQFAGINMLLGTDRYRIQTQNNTGGAIDLQSGISTVAPLGHYKITLYQNTITIDQPSGTDKVYDLSDAVTYKLSANPGFNECSFGVSVSGAATPNGTDILTNLDIRKMGF